MYTKWETVETLLPYKIGYGVRRQHLPSGIWMLVDSGLTELEANHKAEEMNHKIVERENLNTYNLLIISIAILTTVVLAVVTALYLSI